MSKKRHVVHVAPLLLAPGLPGAAKACPRDALGRASDLWNELQAAQFEHEGSKLPPLWHLE